MQSSIVVSPSGTIGTTSTAPIRGCSPWCCVQVDQRDRLGDQPVEGREHRLMLAGQREDRAVVAGVARPIQQVHAVDRFEGGRQLVHDLEPTALGHVRDGLDEHPSMLAPRPGLDDRGRASSVAELLVEEDVHVVVRPVRELEDERAAGVRPQPCPSSRRTSTGRWSPRTPGRPRSSARSHRGAECRRTCTSPSAGSPQRGSPCPGHRRG